MIFRGGASEVQLRCSVGAFQLDAVGGMPATVVIGHSCGAFELQLNCCPTAAEVRVLLGCS